MGETLPSTRIAKLQHNDAEGNITKILTPSEEQGMSLKHPSNRNSFLLDVAIRQEPRGKLGRYFLAAEKVFKERNVSFSKRPFSELHPIYEQYKSTWNGLAPFFDERVNEVPDEEGACFIGYNDEGEPVTTTAIRVLDLKGKALSDEFTSLRFFVGDRADEKVKYTCAMPPIASTMTGRLLYCGAYWVREDWRGRGLGDLVPAVACYFGFARWNVDYKITFGSNAFLSPEIKQLYQFEDYQPGFEFRRNGEVWFKGVMLWGRKSFVLAELDERIERLKRSELIQVRRREKQLPSAVLMNRH
jgi:hypothetical protein